VPLAETKALLAEGEDRENMPTEYKLRLLSALRKEHVRAVQFIQQLRDDIERTAAQGDIEQARIKRMVLTRLLPHDAEFRILMARLAAEIGAATPSAKARQRSKDASGFFACVNVPKPAVLHSGVVVIDQDGRAN
jgi:hypothetical protein